MARTSARSTVTVGAAALTLVAGLGALQVVAGSPSAQAQGLTPWSTCDQLLDHYRTELRAAATPYGFDVGDARRDSTLSFAFSTALDDAPSSGLSLESAAHADPETGTNVQERGVDEPDVAKLVDGRVVSVSSGRLRLLSADEAPRLLGSTPVDADRPDLDDLDPSAHQDAMFVADQGTELLVVGDRVVVLTSAHRTVEVDATERTPMPRLRSWSSDQVVTTTAHLFDVAGDTPQLVERLRLDGRYVSARLVGETVRLVTASTPTPATQVHPRGSGRADQRAALAANQEAAARITLDDVLPQQRRTAADGTVLADGAAVDCGDVAHAQSPAGHSTLLVTTLGPPAGLDPVDRDGVTTDGDTVYASADRLYVATGRWGSVLPRPWFLDDLTGPGPATRPGADPVAPEPDDGVTTELHAFDTSSADRTEYVASGSVPGYLLNRWALSEHHGVLRVASTLPATWKPSGREDRPSSSMVVKLVERGGELVETGRLEGLGVTEEIKSVRYLGDLAAVVTFREVDPLYLVDLSGQPRLLGELKVPGFSAYLHPIGDGLLLAVGRGEGRGRAVDHVQFSVFDVSDPSEPRLVDTHDLGRGYSEALTDAHAVSYDPVRRLATIPFMPGHRATELAGVHVGSDGRLTEAGSIPVGDDPGGAGWRVFSTEERLLAVGPRHMLTVRPSTFTKLAERHYDD